MPKVAIVCDSTCDLGPEWFTAHEVSMVPLKVLIGEDTYRDWVDLQPGRFYELLATAPKLPTTSQPSPADFAATYAALAQAGAEEIVSIHLTGPLSGTVESATMAAKDAQVPVRVVDTRTVSLATGLVVKAAVAERDRGGDAASVEAVAVKTAEEVRLFFILDTLEYLVKGGRAGKASGLAAAVLKIKPILTFNSEGTIEPFKKVKGLKKAMAEVASFVAEQSRSGRVRVAILHGNAPELADQMRAALDGAGADYEFDCAGLIGTVIGTYAGPGAVGVAFHPIR